ncbi:RAMP superfamily CRISPR-associated protein [Gloeocapsopsis dulcis]|uniref:CRISPR type III-associated protein domain-containing protein n=1 Tax=Gloeocapsopsis dulcis AAB1 = 1H9 TaxID=1433147 RepID=A0A6N8FZW1_9CHRO|nr:RAMP superfamily CRISPR-associated protein [Gloeocapsopsis dulcis]MUL38192.1 hypothetical protein [Gloeocapsopsis dulcis AAB1 = 1H9]WNN90776.1 RAMP superfamily CRISPR-associated protein [Gloeocapsopsis dulcis]
MVPERPRKPNPPQRSNHQSNGSNRGNGGTNNPNNQSRNEDSQNPPSPWIEHPLDPKPHPDQSASFVEYLRWMRSLDSEHKDSTKVQMLQMAAQQTNYRDRLTQLTQRTQLIAGEGNSFQVQCPWRIRVGGHKGPESTLLPAFDALGMPYIPSSTLRGVARAIASRDTNFSEAQIKEIFGDVNPQTMGKVIFLDAYPLPGEKRQGGLKPDMANAIWKRNAEHIPEYNTNPNVFLSLEKPTFVIGIRPIAGCDEPTLQQVKQWLVNGLAQGIGSQINSGYGGLESRELRSVKKKVIIKVAFELQGQLTHGRQEFQEWQFKDRWKALTKAESEVRPIAFRSMLRYWFRAFALGVLAPQVVRDLEMEIFGGIEPKCTGLFRIEATGKVSRDNARPNQQGKNDPCGLATGTLILRNSSQTASLEEVKKAALNTILKNLTWMMFHLGGVGQGARRPCYSRKTRDRAPWWRGSTLIPDSNEPFWNLPETVTQFQQLFRQQLQSFYSALQQFTGNNINVRSLLAVGQVKGDQWIEAIDANCRIVVCTGEPHIEKPYALAVLHDPSFKQGSNYDGNLCGKVSRGVKPSPVWIADLDNYQVVTVFGATQEPRKKYLKELRDRTDSENYAQIFPF